ncbi:hypothetical protein TWF481_011722 [Arthrobotrys musiformis]|uniref:Uncharacterized protein n=1 Tax=Arthrobotrys musiformis TaxID=47236 RepID=A0AAV9VZ50_9PEZI
MPFYEDGPNHLCTLHFLSPSFSFSFFACACFFVFPFCLIHHCYPAGWSNNIRSTMRSISVIFAVLVANMWAVSATVQWKDSISRFSTDLLRKKYKNQQTDKFLTIMNRLKPALGKDPTENPLFIELPMDHFGIDNNETISCRYYVQEAYYKPGGPVIFHDIGEASIGPYAKGLVDEDEFSVAIAKRFNGLLILFEHRFYGQSAPTTSTSTNLGKASRRQLTEFFKYHTIEQALEDVVYFAKNFSYDLEEYPKQVLTPDKTPWVWVGVSYSGARGAWMAKRNPGLFKATLASSAPVQLKVNFWEYFTAIEDALVVKNKNCSADLSAAARWLSDAWDNRDHSLVDQLIDAVYEKDWEESLEQYDPESEEIWDIRKDYLQDAAWTPFSDFQYYGVNGGTLGVFCDIMETTYSTRGDPDGVFETQSLEKAVTAYAKAVAAISPYSYTSSRQRSQSNKKRQLSSGSLDDKLDDYSWLWQVCTEFGAFQVANTSRPQNLLPSFIDVQSQIDSCLGTFGESEQVSRAGPNVDPINEKYQGWYVQLSNTMWTNGQYDPWKALSIDSEEEDAPTNDTATTNIPQCGKTFPEGTQLRYVIKDGYHGSEFSEDVVTSSPGDLDDLEPTNTIRSLTATKTRTRTKTALTGTPVVDAVNAQNLWFSAMSSWLPCTTLQFNLNENTAETTSSAPFTSRTPFQTGSPDDAAQTSGSSDSSGDKKSSAAPLAVPALIIPVFVSIFAFLAGIRVVV